MPSKKALEDLYQVKDQALEDPETYFQGLKGDPLGQIGYQKKDTKVELIPEPKALKAYAVA